MKTSTLTGAALDWAVAKCEGKTDGEFVTHDEFYWDDEGLQRAIKYTPSTNLAQGGPIIEREDIEVKQGSPLYFPKGNEKGDYYEALWIAGKQHGTTPLIAAMRYYVASKLGAEVDVPECLRHF